MAFEQIEADGFDNYAVGTQRWTIGSTLSCSPTHSRHAWGQGAINNGVAQPIIETPQITGPLRFEGAFNLQTLTNPTVTDMLGFGKMGVSSGGHVALRLSTTKHPYIVHSESGTVLLGPTTGPEHVIEVGNWYWIQVYLEVHATLGVVTLGVNGDTWLTGTNLNTKHSSFSSTIDMTFLSHGGIGSVFRYDDFVWHNGATSPFIGDMIVIGKRGIAAGAFTEFDLVGAATNHEATDEIVRDDDTSYVHSTVIGARDTYIIENITEVPGNSTVLAVQQAWAHRKDEPGTRSARSILRVDTDEVLGPERFPSETSYLTSIEESHMVQPDGSSAWGDVDNFNALDVEIGHEIVS